MRYSIEGEPLPVVICNLEQGEVMITESGAMSWMSPNMKMETTGGGIGKMFGRALSGESIFLNRLHGNEREWDDRVCIVVPGINPGV
nr:AIM24 family protein [Roseburia hominis]